MKNLTLFFLISLASMKLFAQNLVLNHSFEDTLNDCDSMHYFICENWVNPNGDTADHFNAFSDVMDCWGSVFKTPNTILGHQIPQNGGAYLGLVLYEPNGSDTKEYGQGFLSQALIAGQTYHVAMYINMTDSSTFKTCEIEIAFSDQLIYSTGGSMNLMNKVQFDISDVDSINWKLLTGTYVANGGEKYIYIGSNTLNSDLSCVQSSTVGVNIVNAAYYIIDNVYVSESPLEVIEQSNSSALIFPNIIYDIVNIQTQQLNERCYLTDLNGRILLDEVLTKKNNELDLMSFPNGMYLLNLEKERISYKIIITH